MRRAGLSIFVRVLAVVVAAGVVSLALATIVEVQLVRAHVEAQLVEGAVDRAEQLRDEVDHSVDLSRSELRAVALAAASGQVLEVPSIVTGSTTAVRCMRGDDELLDAASSQEAHARLRAGDPPAPGDVRLLDDGHLVVSIEASGVDTHAVLDLNPVLTMPAGWSAAFVAGADGTAVDATTDPAVAAQVAAGGVVAERRVDPSGAEHVVAETQARCGVGVSVTAPLAPARAAAFGISRNILLWSSLALIPLLIMALVFGRAVTQPVRSLARAVRGAKSSPVELPQLPSDEIGDLGAAIGSMSKRLEADARALRIAVAFSRRVSILRDGEEILAALERAMREALPDAEWFVMSRRAVDDGELSRGVGLTVEQLQEALVARHGEREHPSRKNRLAEDGSDRLSAIEIPVTLFTEERKVRIQMSLRHRDDAFGVVVGRGPSEEAVSVRHAELLCRTAVAAIRNAELVGSMLANEKLAVLGRLSAEVTHEMSNPLAFVLANLRVLETELEGDAKEAIAESRAGAERLERIVRDLSSLARGGIRMDLEDLDLTAVAREAAAVARARNTGATVDVDVRGAVPVYADGGRLEQVFVNLIANGIDAAVAAGVTAPRITVQVRVEGDQAVAAIADNGPGIPRSARRQIFEAFFTTKGSEGTGLGLYVARSLAQAQGGDLALESTGDSGTTFVMTLPLAEERADRRAALSKPTTSEPGRAPAPKDPSRRILILDDEVSLVRALSRWLGRWAEVDGTSDPQEALSLAEKRGYTMILCDLNMPAMPGTDFIAALSERAPDAASRVVIMTGSGAAEIPGVPVVSKPIQPAVIEELLLYR